MTLLRNQDDIWRTDSSFAWLVSYIRDTNHYWLKQGEHMDLLQRLQAFDFSIEVGSRLGRSVRKAFNETQSA